MTLGESLQAVLEALYEHWRNNTGEHDRSDAGGLAHIFKASGGKFGKVPPAPQKVPDWCGLTVGAALADVGVHPDLVKSFPHCLNVEAFFTYGRQKNVNPKRLATEVLIDGQWVKIEDWHRSQGKERLWIPESVLRAGDASGIGLAPGDVVLIDYQGPADARPDESSDTAEHITTCASFNVMGPGILQTIEGNAEGKGPDGKPRRDSVIVNDRDLNQGSQRKRLFGAGRFSELDFEPGHTYR